MRRSGSLRLRLGLQLALLHAVLAAASYFAWQDEPLRLALAEAGLLLSATVAVYLVSRVDLHRRLVAEGRDLLRDEDFGARLREVGLEEVDALVRLFNATIERLREERVRTREQEAFLERLVEASPTAIILLDLDDRVATVNPAGRELLATDRPLAGQPLVGLPEPFGAALDQLEDRTSTVIAVGARRFKASRARFWDRGFPRSFLLLAELTEELRRSEREAWGRLVRTISHEVNNSAGAVASLLDSCRAELAEGRAGREVEEALAAGARRIRALESFVAGYAEVVRLPPPDRRPLDLSALLGDLLVVLGPELRERSVTVGWERHQQPVWISADANQLERVLVNVIRNAAESIGQGGTIRLDLACRAGVATLRVVDDGAGIEPAALERLFTPFFSTKRDGRGLGLTLVREILAAHDFAFALEPGPGEGARRGACFSFEAPLGAAPDPSLNRP